MEEVGGNYFMELTVPLVKNCVLLYTNPNFTLCEVQVW